MIISRRKFLGATVGVAVAGTGLPAVAGESIVQTVQIPPIPKEDMDKMILAVVRDAVKDIPARPKQ